MKSLAEINKLNSGAKSDYIVELQEKIDTLASQDLTPGQVEIQQLQLAKRIQEAAEIEKEAKREFEKSVKQIEEDAALAKAELELKYQVKQGTSIEDLIKEAKTLENRVAKGKEELTFGLREEKAKHTEKLRKLEEEYKAKNEELEKKLEAAKEKLEADLKKAEEKAQVETEKIGENIDKLKKDQVDAKTAKELAVEELKQAKAREITKIEYDHQLAVETRDLDTTTKILKGYKKVHIDLVELNEIKAKAEDTTKLKEEEVEKIKKEAESKVYSAEGSKYGKLKSATDQEIAILGAKNEHLESVVSEAKARILTLENQIAQFPTQLREAVEAAKTPVTQVVEANKK